MKFNSVDLLSQLTQRTEQFIMDAQVFQNLSLAQLNAKASPEKWSALECLEHLNLYGDFYIPAIQKAIKESTHKSETVFKSGWLGHYFANAMEPNEQMKTMNSPKDKNPMGSDLSKEVINRFLKQQADFLQLLGQTEKVNLAKAKVPITISKFIRLKLGDTFRFNIAHTDRHLQQAKRALKS